MKVKEFLKKSYTSNLFLNEVEIRPTVIQVKEEKIMFEEGLGFRVVEKIQSREEKAINLDLKGMVCFSSLIDKNKGELKGYLDYQIASFAFTVTKIILTVFKKDF